MSTHAESMPDEPESGEQFEHQPSAMNGLLVTLLLPAMAIAYLVLRGFAGFSWVEGTMFVAGYLLTAFGITAGYHRLVTHSAYVLSRPARWILIALGSMALQGPIFYWAATHRRHHRHADRAGDPHSPVYGQPRSFPGVVKGLLHAQAGWFLDARLGAWSDSYIPDLICDPQLRLLDKLFRLFAVLSFVIPTVVGALFHRAAVGALDGLFWGGVIRLVAVHQATFSVNSICHLFGTRPYPTEDASRNNFPVALLTLGEGWHNNHHAFPTSAYHGLRWWQVDLTGWVISLLQLLNVATEVEIARPPWHRGIGTTST